MTCNIKTDMLNTEEDIYIRITEELKHFLKPDEPLISGLSNFVSLLKYSFKKISWIGFYINKDGNLWLGPFQGKPACVKISSGKGVCGAALIQGETIIVEDVNNFPEHIACDAESNSEIVVPLFINGNIWGVLDLDSNALNAFSKSDKKYLENMCNFLAETLNFNESLI